MLLVKYINRQKIQGHCINHSLTMTKKEELSLAKTDEIEAFENFSRYYFDGTFFDVTIRAFFWNRLQTP
jgi:hypothetical protein